MKTNVSPIGAQARRSSSKLYLAALVVALVTVQGAVAADQKGGTLGAIKPTKATSTTVRTVSLSRPVPLEITGSRLKQRVTLNKYTTATASPVVVLSRDDVRRTGTATLSQALDRAVIWR